MAYYIAWDESGKKLYETGSKMAVLYPQKIDGSYDYGVAWSGLTGVDESPSGADATDLWADDIKYLSIRSAEEFGFTIKAYMYPDEFGECDGTAEVATGMTVFQQSRRGFGLCYRTTVGNDAAYNDYGYKLHLIYGATCAPSSRSFSTINDSPSAIEFSWECKTTPIAIPGFKPSAEIVLDSTKIDPVKMAQIESILYGTAGTPGTKPRLPMPAELIEILGSAVTDATLTGITIASATLAPEFDDEVFAYTATTSSSSSAITITAGTGVDIDIKVNGETVANEGSASWNAGNNAVVITATKPGCNTTVTNITVIKS